MRFAEDYAPLNIDLSSPARADRAKWVCACMVDAFETLRRLPDAGGPKGFGTNWPATFRDIGQLMDDLFGRNDNMPPTRRPPSIEQVSRMEEALRWPAEFLSDLPKAADALTLWAMCKASGLSIRAALHARNRRATEIARLMETERNAQRAIERREIARQVATWANERLVGATPERAERIRANATIRLQRSLEEAGLLAEYVIVDPKEAFPDMVITQGGVDEWRWRGARMIADGLSRT